MEDRRPQTESGVMVACRRITGGNTSRQGLSAEAQCRRLPGIDMIIENGRRRHCVLPPDVMRHAALKGGHYTMRLLILLTLISVSIVVPQTDTVRFDGHEFIYQLSSHWKRSSSSPSEAYLDILYKREPIRDSKGIAVIPNLIIKLIRIVPDTSRRTASDSVRLIDMFTGVCLLNYAPPEVFRDYRKSKNIAREYGITDTNSYGFNSPYSDNFGAKHTCLYFTMYERDRFGLFLCIDSTEEVFEKVKPEVMKFLRSMQIT